MKPALSVCLNEKSLRQIAGSVYFQRGQGYFHEGLVHNLIEHEGTVTAKVSGNDEYRVKLWIEGKDLDYSCSCPLGSDGAFCKHCVAVGLAWISEQKDGSNGFSSKKGTSKPSSPMKDLEFFLKNKEKDSLIEIIMKQALEDDHFRDQLLMQAAKKSPKGFNEEAYRRAIDNAIQTDYFVDYSSVYDYAQPIEEVMLSVESLIDAGHAGEAVELTEYFLVHLERTLQSIDDSSGTIGNIIHSLQEIHLNACKESKPDPEALAKRLFQMELNSDFDLFYGGAKIYADILGENGLRHYRKLAEAAWAKVPALGPGDEKLRYEGKRSNITHIMETLAEMSGDSEDMIRILSHDLSHSYNYLKIAEIYKKNRQFDKALEWAEKGLKAFPDRPDSRTRDFLAEEYHRRGLFEDEMGLMWAEFTDQPELDNYRKLKKHADNLPSTKNGTSSSESHWFYWREKAPCFIRDDIAKDKKKESQSSWWGLRTDHSLLVEIFLWEKDGEAAWKEAREGGCSKELWLRLAEKREEKYPTDSIEVYKRQIEPTVNQKNNLAYEEATCFLHRIGKLMTGLGQKETFSTYVESLRTAHKPKRNFIKLLERIK